MAISLVLSKRSLKLYCEECQRFYYCTNRTTNLMRAKANFLSRHALCGAEEIDVTTGAIITS